MKNLTNMLLLSLFFVIGFTKSSDFKVNSEVAIEVDNGNPVIIENSTNIVPQSREEIDLYTQDFEGDVDWTTPGGWNLTESNSHSETHSMHSPNDDTTLNGTWDLLSPIWTLPALGEGETMGFTFYLYVSLIQLFSPQRRLVFYSPNAPLTESFHRYLTSHNDQAIDQVCTPYQLIPDHFHQ